MRKVPLVALALALGAGSAFAVQGEGTLLGEEARNVFAVEWAGGMSVELDNLRGNVVVIDLYDIPGNC